ncbi:MAG: hypothetical protein WD969_10355 [Paracoccaceae bacterium]
MDEDETQAAVQSTTAPIRAADFRAGPPSRTIGMSADFTLDTERETFSSATQTVAPPGSSATGRRIAGEASW